MSISQAVQGQNFQPGIDWEVEMPQNNFGDYLSPGPAGSSGNHEQASGSLQVPCLALASGTQRRPCGSEEPGGRLDNQASVSVSQRVRKYCIWMQPQRALDMCFQKMIFRSLSL